MASRRKDSKAFDHEVRRLQHLGAEQMEENFRGWYFENAQWLIEIVLNRAAEEKQTVEEAAYGIFLDCLRLHQHTTQINLGKQIESEGDTDEEEAA